MISVIIPTQNRLENLKTAISSVFNQTTMPLELIVVDDCSNEPVKMEVFKAAPSKIECRIVRLNKIRGANYARNIGIEKAQGKYIAMLDDDDLFLPNKIKVMKDYIANHPYVDVFYHRSNIFLVKENISYSTFPIKQVEDDFLNKMLIKNVVGGTPMLVLKRQTLQEIKGFDISLKALQDYELLLRLVTLGYKFKYVDKLLTTCRLTTQTPSISKSIISHNSAVKTIELKYKKYFEKMSAKDSKLKRINNDRLIIHKLLLSKEKNTALKMAIKLLLKTGYFQYAFFTIAILLGDKFVLLIRKRFSIIFR